MPRKSNVLCSLVALALACTATDASAQRLERWADAKPYGLFFNDDAPNFYTGFMPRVQERNRIKIHLARGNQPTTRNPESFDAIEVLLPGARERSSQRGTPRPSWSSLLVCACSRPARRCRSRRKGRWMTRG